MMTTSSFYVSVQELCECEDITESMLTATVDHEIVTPVRGSAAKEWVFDATHVVWIRKAIHLHRDLELDWVAIAVVVDLLREKERLEQVNQALELRLQRLSEPS